MKFNLLDDSFYVALTFKSIDGVLEIIGGLILFFARPETINSLVRLLTEHELVQDPRDFVARHLLVWGTTLAIAHITAAVYLITHGVAKIVLVVAMLQKQLWAYVGSIALLSGFILYQTYRIGYTHSLLLTALTLIDVVIVGLIWLEWQKVRRMTA